MDKYKSWIVPEKHIDVSTHRRWFNEEHTDGVFVVEIKHIPSGIIASSENKAQMKAYNETLKTIENYILEKNYKQRGKYILKCLKMEEKHKIIPSDKICVEKNLTKGKEYEILEIDDDMPMTPDEYYKIENDLGFAVWIDDWDCERIL